jgi:hypothetical protein
MPTSIQYLLSYGPLAFTLSTSIIDIALTTNTTSNSRKSQQGAQNFYKAIRKYNSKAIALASTWTSGYLTYLKLTDGTYIDVTDIVNKVKSNPKSVFVNEPVLLSGVALGVNGINIVARIFNQAATSSLSSSKRLNANKVFDILGDNVLPQLSGGLLVGVIGGSLAGAGKLLFTGKENIFESILSNVGISDGIVSAVKRFTEPQLNAYADIITSQVVELQTIATTGITTKITQDINSAKADTLEDFKTGQNALIGALNTGFASESINIVIPVIT